LSRVPKQISHDVVGVRSEQRRGRLYAVGRVGQTPGDAGVGLHANLSMPQPSEKAAFIQMTIFREVFAVH
jgi:hypothetical protein